jgi:hypothetical protein
MGLSGGRFLMGLKHASSIPWLLLFLAIATGVLGSGCASGGKTAASMTPQRLAIAISALGSAVDPAEAQTLAYVAYDRAWELRKDYRVVQPPHLHNLLVNVGIRKRGVCYHWADDLAITLQYLGMRTLKVYECVAFPRSLRRHYSLVVCATGQSYEEGIVLDAWRLSGRIWWCPVKEDSYAWQPFREFLPPQEITSQTVNLLKQ